MKQSNLPDFFLIGAMKSGTSSLHHYLDAQKGVSMSSIKEPNYFAKYRTVFHKGIGWYASLFPDNADLKGESSTAYTKYPHVSGVPKRISKRIKHPKFIYLLRHPVDRTLSHASHDMLEGLVPQINFIDGLIRQKENNIYVDCSRYMMQIEQYLSYFSPEQFLLLSHEELKKSPEALLSRIFDFLGIEGAPDLSVISEMRNVSKERTVIVDREEYQRTKRMEMAGKLPEGSAESLRQPFVPPGITEVAAFDLMEDLKPDLDRLYEFAGRDFGWEL